MRHYLLPENNKQFKANLHCHTTISDGTKTPEEMKAIYKERGYNILAITDHGKLVDHSALDDEDFLMITAVEYWVGGGDKKLANTNIDRAMEFNLFAKDQHNASLEPFKAMPRTYSGEYMQFVIDTANKNGFLVCLNHPGCSYLNIEFIRRFDGIFAMEVYNRDAILCGVIEGGMPLYTEAIRSGKPWCCIASDDAHGIPGTAYPAQGFVMISAEELKYDKIMASLEAGDFYASSGPVIEELYIEDGEIHLKCSPVKFIGVATNGRPIGGAKKVNQPDEYLTEVDIKIREGTEFVRFDLEDEHGNWAHTRAYYVDGRHEPACTNLYDENYLV